MTARPTPLACTACGAPMEPSPDDYARCRFCGAVAALPARAATTAAATTARPPIALPAGITVADERDGITITRRWFHWIAIVLLLFTVVWDGFLWTFYATVVGGDAPLLAYLFPVVHVAVGAALTYWTLGLFLNRTVIEASRGALRVRHGPLPWKAPPVVAGDAVAQVFTREDRSDSPKDTGGKSYSVHAVLKDGTRMRLLGTIPQVEHALYVEQRIERHLGIEDRVVAGELPRD